MSRDYEYYQAPQLEVMTIVEEQLIAQSVLETLNPGDEWDWE